MENTPVNNENEIKKTPWDWVDYIYIVGHPIHEQRRINYVLRKLREFECPQQKMSLSAPTWGRDLTTDTIFRVYDPFLPRKFPNLIFKSRALTKGEVSLNLNFYSAVKDANEKGYERIMILESDVMFRHDFLTRFAEIQSLADQKVWHYISLSDGTGTHGGGINFGDLYYHKQELVLPATCFPFRCTDSMLLSRDFIKHLAENLLPFRDCLDWELNYRLLEFKGAPYWPEPHLFEQASLKRVDESILASE